METEMISFSSKSINFGKEKSFQLQVTNKNPTHCLVFKTKVTKLSIYEVKPSLGSIDPLGKKQIQFKIIKSLTTQEMIENHQKDKFQLKFLMALPTAIPKDKPELKAYWKQIETTAGNQDKFCNYNFEVNFGDASGTSEIEPPPTNKNPTLYTVTDSQRSSLLQFSSKVGDKSSLITGDNSESTENAMVGGQQLSQRHQKLKDEEERLVNERERAFKQQQQRGGGKGMGCGRIALLIVVFLLSVMMGNFLKRRVFMDEQL